jgi:hypothetical protein
VDSAGGESARQPGGTLVLLPKSNGTQLSIDRSAGDRRRQSKWYDHKFQNPHRRLIARCGLARDRRLCRFYQEAVHSSSRRRWMGGGRCAGWRCRAQRVASASV